MLNRNLNSDFSLNKSLLLYANVCQSKKGTKTGISKMFNVL